MRILRILSTASLLSAWLAVASAQPAGERRRPELPPIVLAADDVRAFPDAPAGYNASRPGIPAGRIEMFEYDSGVTGTRRKANVYLPPGYSADRKYPVLYLLHGIGGDETEWIRFVNPVALFDNLVADGKAVPMIVVFPNGRALPDDRAGGDAFAPEKVEGFTKFERDLFEFLIPAVERKYSVDADRTQRALAGLSMGGGQTLNFGLTHPETFAWIGAFSSAPNSRPPAELLPDPRAATKDLRLIYLSCGKLDRLFPFSQRMHAHLKAHEVPHIWNVDDFDHDPKHWGSNLWHFAQRLFREE